MVFSTNSAQCKCICTVTSRDLTCNERKQTKRRTVIELSKRYVVLGVSRLALAIETVAHLSQFADLSILKLSFIVVAVAIFSNESQIYSFLLRTFSPGFTMVIIYKRSSIRMCIAPYLMVFGNAAAAAAA